LKNLPQRKASDEIKKETGPNGKAHMTRGKRKKREKLGCEVKAPLCGVIPEENWQRRASCEKGTGEMGGGEKGILKKPCVLMRDDFRKEYGKIRLKQMRLQ